MTLVSGHSIQRAELLAVGTELLVGETQDTNSGELARELTALGVEVLRATALPDRLEASPRRFDAAWRMPTSWSPPAGWARRRTT